VYVNLVIVTVCAQYMTNSDIDEVKKSINELDFSMIIKKLISEQGWTENEALSCEQLYRNFLFLKKKYGHKYKLPPTRDIDEFWHNHILDTKKYIQDCNSIFGKYLHHYPYAGLDGVTTYSDLKNYLEKLQELHKLEFGYYIYKVRFTFFEIIIEFLSKIINQPFNKRISTHKSIYK